MLYAINNRVCVLCPVAQEVFGLLDFIAKKYLLATCDLAFVDSFI